MQKKTAKSIKTEKDLSDFCQQLAKITIETALNAELEHHLGYAKNELTNSENSRNGYSLKTVKTEEGQLEVAILRDHKGEFEPQLIKKHQTRFSSVDEKIQYLYAKGLTTREIEDIFQELYGVEVSAGLISKVSKAVTEQIIEWQSRSLEAIYPLVYLDCIVVKIRQDKTVINKAIYRALGVNLDGQKEFLDYGFLKTRGQNFGFIPSLNYKTVV